MLTRELMGLGALAILWVNTLLIAAAAWKELSKLLAKKRALADAGVVRGRVVKGTLAALSVEQTGHGNGESPNQKAILFHDRKHTGEVFGGVVEIDGKEIEIPARASGEVWIALEQLRREGEYPGDDAFDAAFVNAKRAKGYARTVTAKIGEGADVWLAKDGSFVSTIDPAPLLSKYASLAFAAIVGFFAAVTGITFLALQTPHFGTVSIVGGVLGLAYFLTVQPLGTMLRDAVRLPSVAWLRGDWIRKVASVSTVSAPAETSAGE